MPESDNSSLERLLARTGSLDPTAASQLSAALSASDQELAKTLTESLG